MIRAGGQETWSPCSLQQAPSHLFLPASNRFIQHLIILCWGLCGSGMSWGEEGWIDPWLHGASGLVREPDIKQWKPHLNKYYEGKQKTGALTEVTRPICFGSCPPFLHHLMPCPLLYKFQPHWSFTFSRSLACFPCALIAVYNYSEFCLSKNVYLFFFFFNDHPH